MIKVLETEKDVNSGQLNLTVQIDAKAANIRNQDEKYKTECNVGKRLVALSNAVARNGETCLIEQELREFLRDDLFKHYVDVVSINDFIYDLRTTFKNFKQNIALAGYTTTYKYKNYEGVE